jgi:Bacterial PH domain
VENPVDDPRVVFVPDRRLTALAAAGTLVAGLVAAFGTDPAGQFLAAVAAAVLAAYTVSDLVFSPRLEAGSEGVIVRAPLTRARLRWDEVEDVRADSRSRLGIRSTSLEIDAGPVLAVLTRRAIGTDPELAAARVAALRPR